MREPHRELFRDALRRARGRASRSHDSRGQRWGMRHPSGLIGLPAAQQSHRRARDNRCRNDRGGSHWVARPVPGLGIAMPVLLPPVLAALTAVFLDREHAAPLAYVAGSLGTLLGADILNLHRLQQLGAPVASIGGAGTSDGIFLTGIIAVVLA